MNSGSPDGEGRSFCTETIGGFKSNGFKSNGDWAKTPNHPNKKNRMPKPNRILLEVLFSLNNPSSTQHGASISEKARSAYVLKQVDAGLFGLFLNLRIMEMDCCPIVCWAAADMPKPTVAEGMGIHTRQNSEKD